MYGTPRPKGHRYWQNRGDSMMSSPGVHQHDAYDVRRMNVISKAMGNFDNIVSVFVRAFVRVCVRACLRACARACMRVCG